MLGSYPQDAGSVWWYTHWTKRPAQPPPPPQLSGTSWTPCPSLHTKPRSLCVCRCTGPPKTTRNPREPLGPWRTGRICGSTSKPDPPLPCLRVSTELWAHFAAFWCFSYSAQACHPLLLLLLVVWMYQLCRGGWVDSFLFNSVQLILYCLYSSLLSTNHQLFPSNY